MTNCCNKRLKNFRWDASNGATAIYNVFSEDTRVCDASDSVMNPVFKIYSPFDVLLISKKPRRRENVWLFRPYVGFHNENAGRFSLGNRTKQSGWNVSHMWIIFLFSSADFIFCFIVQTVTCLVCICVRFDNSKTTIVLTHNSGRVTQICVFNTVKLGTSESSP